MNPSGVSPYRDHDADQRLDDTCPVCLMELRNGQKVVVHADEGHKHPIHEQCALNCLKNSSKCPSCRNEVAMGPDGKPLPNEWSEKVVRNITSTVKDLMIAAITASVVKGAAALIPGAIGVMTAAENLVNLGKISGAVGAVDMTLTAVGGVASGMALIGGTALAAATGTASVAGIASITVLVSTAIDTACVAAVVFGTFQRLLQN